MKKVLWIGPIVPSDEVSKYKAISAAANVWQMGFINGLIENDFNVTLVSYVPYPTWPKGPLWAAKPFKANNYKQIKQYYFGYLNLIYIREIWIAAMIFSLALLKISNLNRRIIFTYNPYPRHWFAVKWLRLIFRSKWVSIIADDSSFGNPDFHLFLSFDYFTRFEKANKLFCDGGIILRSFNGQHDNLISSTPPKSLVFAGTLNEWTGIIDFIDLFNEIDAENYILHIYGKGDPEVLRNKSLSLKNKIILHGFVNDIELEQACRKAYAFINPRPLHLFRSENNFPSKLLLYLSYNKPVISTKTKGLSPDYDNILSYYTDSETLKKCIDLINDRENYENMVRKISSFNTDNTWFKKVKNITKAIAI